MQKPIIWDWTILLVTTYWVVGQNHSAWWYLLAFILLDRKKRHTVLKEKLVESQQPQQIKSCWETLSCSIYDSPAMITTVYKAKAKVLHPDMGGSKEKFQELQNAYQEALKIRRMYENQPQGNL